jgi:hypothetical protein
MQSSDAGTIKNARAEPIILDLRTPTAAATTNVVIKVTDKAGGTASKTLPLVIAGATPLALAISTASLPSGQATLVYTATLVAANGTPPYSWIATPLPPGLALMGADIVGIPTAAGTTNVVVTVTDSTSATASKKLAIVVATAPLQVRCLTGKSQYLTI